MPISTKDTEQRSFSRSSSRASASPQGIRSEDHCARGTHASPRLGETLEHILVMRDRGGRHQRRTDHAAPLSGQVDFDAELNQRRRIRIMATRTGPIAARMRSEPLRTCSRTLRRLGEREVDVTAKQRGQPFSARGERHEAPPGARRELDDLPVHVVRDETCPPTWVSRPGRARAAARTSSKRPVRRVGAHRGDRRFVTSVAMGVRSRYVIRASRRSQRVTSHDSVMPAEDIRAAALVGEIRHRACARAAAAARDLPRARRRLLRFQEADPFARVEIDATPGSLWTTTSTRSGMRNGSRGSVKSTRCTEGRRRAA